MAAAGTDTDTAGCHSFVDCHKQVDYRSPAVKAQSRPATVDPKEAARNHPTVAFHIRLRSAAAGHRFADFRSLRSVE